MVVLSDIGLTSSATWEDCVRLTKRPDLGIIVLVIFPLMNGVDTCVTLIFRRSTFVWQTTLIGARLLACACMIIIWVESHVMTVHVCSYRNRGK